MKRVGVLFKPSKRASVKVAVLLVVVVSAYFVGSGFNGYSGEGAYELGSETIVEAPHGQEIESDSAHASANAAAASAASDAQKAVSGVSYLAGWLFSSSASTAGSVDVAGSAEAFAERMVVFSAKLDLKVEDIDSVVDQIRLLTERYGGFVAAVSTRSGGGAVTIRVPQLSFYEALLEVEGFGEVVNRDVKGEDVTESFVDLQARLVNLQAQEARLQEILDMATTVEDVLKVEKELERVRGEIEGLTGDLQYLESRVELATITVLMNEAIEKEMWWPQVDWLTPVSTGLSALFTILQGLLTMVVVVGPFAVVGLGGRYLYRRVRSNDPRVKVQPPGGDGEDSPE